MKRLATRRWYPSSMHGRLSLTLIAVAVLPLLAVVAVLGPWSHATLERQHLQLQEETARRVATEIGAVLRAVEHELSQLDDVHSFGSLSLTEQRTILDKLLFSNRIYHELAVVSLDGQEATRVSRSRVTLDSDLGTETGEEFTRAIETATPILGPVAFDRNVREPLAKVVVPLLERRTGNVTSAVVAVITFKPMWNVLGETVESEDHDIYVVASDGAVVAHRDPGVVLAGTDVELPSANGRTVGLSGETVVVASEVMQYSGQELVVISEQPVSVAFILATRALQVIVLVAALAMLAALVLAVVAARHVVRPLKTLADSARRITAGDVSHRTIVNGPAELAEVATAFNLMAKRQSEVIHTLEERVKERTADLEQAAAVQHELIGRLEEQALHDALTGLPNRHAFDGRLDIELKRARRLGSRVGILLLDLDGFKEVNDTFGHGLGDQLLIEAGRRLTMNLRAVDALCRIGGDEFAVVQPDIDCRKNAEDLAARLLGAFAQSFTVESQEIMTAASIGITISDDLASKSELMQQADLALYRAKSAGRNTYRCFETDMDAEVVRRMNLAQDLRRAVERGELFIEYQPLVSLSDRCIVSVEALLRWQHPRLGLVPPSEFVPVAEGTGMIQSIGEWVLRAVCEQLGTWNRRSVHAPPIAVNLSAIQLRDPRLVDSIARILSDTGVDPQYLELELTERALVEGKDVVDRALEALGELGVSISLDDFGKGYASLDYLRRLPLTKVKIDQSFVRGMEAEPKDATIVGTVIELAAKLGLGVVAEGVEDGALARRLKDEGCGQAQGFYFSRPISAEAVETLITRGNNRVRSPSRSAVPELRPQRDQAFAKT